MSKKIKTKKRLEIRITDIPEKLYNSIKKVSVEENRTMGKEILNTIKNLY